MTPSLNRLRLDDLDIAWTRVGHRGPHPLLVLHGLGDSAIQTFTSVATDPALDDREALLVDLPGFGHSTAPDSWPGTIEAYADIVLAVLDTLRIPLVSIVAHSMGASLAILIAARAPERIAAMVLAEPLLVREHSELGKAIAKRREDDFVARGYDMLLLATRRQANRGDRAAVGFLGPLRMAHPAILHRSATSLLAERAPSFLEMLATLTMPCVLLVGGRTEVDLSLVPAGIPIERIAEAGHSMMSENPEGFTQAVAAFLAAQTNAGDGR